MVQSGVYMILNVINNKCYVGSTYKFSTRKADHFNDLKKGKHHNSHLQHSYNKYGKDAFQFIILERCSCDERIDKELKWMNIKDSFNRDKGYNQGVPKSTDLVKPSEELIEKRRRISYKQHNIQIPYEQWQAELKAERKRKKEQPKKTKRPVTVVDLETGEFVSEHPTIKACGDALGFSPTQLKKLNALLGGYGKYKHRKSYKGFIFVYSENYDKEFDYSTYRCSTVRNKSTKSLLVSA